MPRPRCRPSSASASRPKARPAVPADAATTAAAARETIHTIRPPRRGAVGARGTDKGRPPQSPGAGAVGRDDGPRSSPSKDLRAPWKPFGAKVRARCSFVFLLALFSILSVRIMHHHLSIASGTAGRRWNAPPSDNLRSRVSKGSGSSLSNGNRRPRVVASDANVDAFAEISSLARTRHRVDDPMLHREGWIPSPDGTQTASNGAEGEERRGEGMGKEDSSRCVPMAAWQTTSYPNCNAIHEIELKLSAGGGSHVFPREVPEYERRRLAVRLPPSSELYEEVIREHSSRKARTRKKRAASGGVREEWIEFLGQGWFRSVWEVEVEGLLKWDEDKGWRGIDESVALKTLRIERDFLEEYYELHRRDALAMERLTPSPYVMEIYGYCGQSAINELANFGIEGVASLWEVARSFRGMEGIEPVSKIRLQLGVMIASGVSHLHSIDYPDFPKRDLDYEDSGTGSHDRVNSNATLVHYDLNPHNIAIMGNGKPKLNDFNVAEFLTWNTKNNRTCGFQGRFREPWWRAPEEMHYHISNYTNPEPLTEKVDVYALGNILWILLTSHPPRGQTKKKSEEKNRLKVGMGVPPKWPSDCNKTRLKTDLALVALEKAMVKCLSTRPEERPTAGEIAVELSEALEKLPEGFGNKQK